MTLYSALELYLHELNEVVTIEICVMKAAERLIISASFKPVVLHRSTVQYTSERFNYKTRTCTLN